MDLSALTLQVHVSTLTLCDDDFAYFEHDFHLVRQGRQTPHPIQGYRGEGQWVDLPPGWAEQVDFLRADSGTTEITQRWQIEMLLIEKDSRGD